MTTHAPSQSDPKQSAVDSRADVRERNDVDLFDFRTPNKFQSTFVRSLTELHKTFASVLADVYSRELRAQVTIEEISAEQLTYEGYIRSMPNPSSARKSSSTCS